MSLPTNPRFYIATRRKQQRTARPDAMVTRCTCGSWAFLYEECPACGCDEVLTPYIPYLKGTHR